MTQHEAAKYIKEMKLVEKYPTCDCRPFGYQAPFQSPQVRTPYKKGDVVKVITVHPSTSINPFVCWPETLPAVWEYRTKDLYGFRIKSLK